MEIQIHRKEVTMKGNKFLSLFVFFISLCLFLTSSSISSDKKFNLDEEIAALTGLTEAVVITDYDISLRTVLDTNALQMKVICTLQNKSSELIDKIDFDLFAREKFYGVRVEIANIIRLAKGKQTPVWFSHRAEPKPDDASQEGSNEFPKITHVNLSQALNKGEDCRLQFEYTITHIDPNQENLPYRIIASMPDGSKEICLLSDFSWIPLISPKDFQKIMELFGRNFFPRMTKPAWKISISHPSSYESMVVDGRLEKMEKSEKETISRWSSCVGSLPQVLIGNLERYEVKGEKTSVVFLLPKKNYQPKTVEAMGHFLNRAYKFYSNLFGPLDGKDIHIATSSADMGGHGAFLGIFLDAPVFQVKRDESKLSPERYFDETAAHELAHSWWGNSVFSFGRGTKFLRESFSNFSAWYLAKELYNLDLFTERMASLFFRGGQKNPLFNPTSDNERLAYDKGPFVLYSLCREMGDEIFFKVFKDFATRFKDSYATFIDFVSICNEVSKRDWMPFLYQWCYKELCPVYRLVSFKSIQSKGGWETSVTIRNEGKGETRCLLELRMEKEAQKEEFQVPEGMEKTFTYKIPARVDAVGIDPLHTSYQGDEKEARLKMLAVKESNWEWMNYWSGTVHGEVGNYEKALDLISRAVSAHEKAVGQAHPAFYFSRGIVYLQMGEKDKANNDLRKFFDRTFNLATASLDRAIGTLAYSGILSGSQEERQNQLQQIFKALSGEDISFDTKLDGWRRWWESHRDNFKVSPNACILSPGGIKKNLD